MFTTVAYSESQDLGGVFGNMAAVPDQHIRTQQDSIFIDQFNMLIGGMGCVGTLGDRLRVVSPSLRRKAPHYIEPLNLLLVPSATPLHDVDMGKVIKLDIDEQLQVESNSNPAAAEQESAVIWLADAQIAPVSGEIFTINANITLAQLAGAWAFSQITFNDVLPTGNYAVVGMRAIVAGGVAARLVPVGGLNRPGCPCSQAINSPEGYPIFRNGYLGEWCVFNQNNPPAVEVLSSAAAGSATYQIFLDLIKK